jgi:hypothetical protein
MRFIVFSYNTAVIQLGTSFRTCTYPPISQIVQKNLKISLIIKECRKLVLRRFATGVTLSVFQLDFEIFRTSQLPVLSKKIRDIL